MFAVDYAIAVLTVAMLSAENIADNEHYQREGYENDGENHEFVEDGSRRSLGRVWQTFRQVFPLIWVDYQRISESRDAKSSHCDQETIIVGGVGEFEAAVRHVLLVCDVIQRPLELIVVDITVGILRGIPLQKNSIIGDDLGHGDGSRDCQEKQTIKKDSSTLSASILLTIAYCLEINSCRNNVLLAVPDENVVITGWS